jgi:predicted N-acetyltransferase YhbS
MFGAIFLSILNMDNAGEEISMCNKAVTQQVSIHLVRLRDIELIHKLKYQAFLPLYEKYHDDETSPATESMDKILDQLKQEDAEYYVIRLDGSEVGGIRIYKIENGVYRVGPIFIIPEFQNKGIACNVFEKIFEIYPEVVTWQLDSILQEVGNCHMYEKLGFRATGNEKKVNDVMTLIEYEKQCDKGVTKV